MHFRNIQEKEICRRRDDVIKKSNALPWTSLIDTIGFSTKKLLLIAFDKNF
jgi:predicted dithiol-disulfide oxidoreductase (DUF899 family)